MTARGLTCGLLTGLALVASPGSATAAFEVSVGPPTPFGAFVPGTDADYLTTQAVTVQTDTATAVLTVQDLTGLGTPGVLYNAEAGRSLRAPLEVAATSSAPGATGTLFAPLDAAARTLVTYAAPLAAPDSVTLGLRQHIAADEPLRSGGYGKALVLTLSTTTP